MGDSEGERHDGHGLTIPAIRHIRGADGIAYARGILCLDMADANGALTPYYIWVDHDGKLRIVATTEPAKSHAGDVSGTIVGQQ